MNRLQAFYRRLACNGPGSLPEWLLFLFLVPLGVLYGTVNRLRAALYRSEIFFSESATVPVISVGNLSVGGTGKTPMVDYLIRFCLAQQKRVAVISRGYGGKKDRGVRVVCQGRGPILGPDQCGDEPYLLARRNPQALVFVSPKRREAVRRAVSEFDAEVILLDDGFQHLAMKRDFDIVLLDARRPFGNGHVLPAGLLRESKSALNRGDLFVLTRCENDSLPNLPVQGPVLHCQHLLSEEVYELQGEKLPLSALKGKQGIAFAGIAEPEIFFQVLRSRGLDLSATIPLSDHCVYGPHELLKLQSACRQADYLITTEKDGVKLSAAVLPLPCYQVPMTLEFKEEGLLETYLHPILHIKEGAR